MTKNRTRTIIIAALVALALFRPGWSAAGPDDPSSFEATRYPAQKALYDFNFDRPAQGMTALKFVRNHIKALKEFGEPGASSIYVVAHGDELHALARANQVVFPETYRELKELADLGVKFRVCRNAAKARGYAPEDFYDVVTVVPAAVAEIARLQGEGYSYAYAEWFPMETTEDLKKDHPELSF